MDNLIVLLQLIVQLIIFIVAIAGNWMVFVKAGRPGWAILIPFYNVYVTLKIARRPGWWLILLFIPIINLIFIVIPFDIAGKFGKGVGYGLGLLFLPFIFYPVLGFGHASYRG